MTRTDSTRSVSGALYSPPSSPPSVNRTATRGETRGTVGRQVSVIGAVPFETPEEAWFWYVCWRKVLHDGGGGRWRYAPPRIVRPCEPVEIGVAIRRLHLQRMILREHLSILRIYGLRGRAPVVDSVRGCRDLALWLEAMNCLGAVLQGKGIVDWLWHPVCAEERSRMLSVPTGRIRSWRAADAVPVHRTGGAGAKFTGKAGRSVVRR
ncbi:MAG: hypothetical protein OD811_04720 [Alphaproteobacteria bacterium]